MNASLWTLLALIMPTAFLPALKMLSRAFPSKTDTDFENALATLYDASDALIKVCRVAYMPNRQLILSVFSAASTLYIIVEMVGSLAGCDLS